MSRAIVVGVGNRDRRDDGIGPAVAERIATLADPDGDLEVWTDLPPLRLLDVWEGADTAVVVDASHAGSEPGAVRVADVTSRALPPRIGSSSTHAFGLADAVELARVLRRLPRRLVLVVVEAADTRPGAGLTPPVEAAVDPAARAALAAATSAATSADRRNVTGRSSRCSPSASR